MVASSGNIILCADVECTWDFFWNKIRISCTLMISVGKEQMDSQMIVNSNNSYNVLVLRIYFM